MSNVTGDQIHRAPCVYVQYYCWGGYILCSTEIAFVSDPQTLASKLAFMSRLAQLEKAVDLDVDCILLLKTLVHYYTHYYYLVLQLLTPLGP
jgi:hypothetical protein